MRRFDWRSLQYGILLGSVLAAPAYAAMPSLTSTPKPATASACERWAGAQDEDAIYMWGMQESGESSNKVALARLTGFCMGKPKPEIVGFGSSVGFDDAFCAKHRSAKICQGR